MNLKRTAAYAQSLPSWYSFQYNARFPERAQAHLWRRIVDEIANGSFWPKRLGRSPEQLSLRDFEITEYADYRPAIKEDFETTRSSLTGRKILYWIESSGTTGGKKLFPLTEAHYSSRKTFNRLHALEVMKHNPTVGLRPALSLSTPARKNFSPTGIEIGASSNYNARYLTSDSISAVPAAVYRDLPTFIQWGGLYAMAGDVSHIMGLAPARIDSFLRELPNKLAEYRPYLRGEKPVPDGLPPVAVDRARLAVIEKALECSPFLLRDLWPSFRALTAWKSSTCALQLPALTRYLSPDDVVLDYAYTASEGGFTLPVGGGIGGPSSIGLYITEFLKLGDEPVGANLRSCWELEKDQEYEVFLTTLMGLVRYRMHDRVRCTGFYREIATLEFIGKTASHILLGITSINEADVMECLKQSPVDFQGPWLIGLRASGNGLILYHQSEVPDIRERAEALDRELYARVQAYGRWVGAGTLVPMEPMHLPTSHQLWRSQPDHAQAKQRIFTSVQPVEHR